MKKKLLILAVIFFAIIAGIFFYKTNKKPHMKSIDVLRNIQSYKCDCTVKVKNTNQEIEENFKQYYKKNVGAKLEFNDKKILLFKDGKIHVNDEKNGSKYSLDKDFDKIFKISIIGEFIRLMYTNDEVKMYTKNIDGIEYDVIELTIPGINRNLYKGRLYVEKQEHIPANLEILNVLGSKRVNIQYKDFQPNVELYDNIFNINK